MNISGRTAMTLKRVKHEHQVFKPLLPQHIRNSKHLNPIIRRYRAHVCSEQVTFCLYKSNKMINDFHVAKIIFKMAFTFVIDKIKQEPRQQQYFSPLKIKLIFNCPLRVEQGCIHKVRTQLGGGGMIKRVHVRIRWELGSTTSSTYVFRLTFSCEILCLAKRCRKLLSYFIFLL